MQHRPHATPFMAFIGEAIQPVVHQPMLERERLAFVDAGMAEEDAGHTITREGAWATRSPSRFLIQLIVYTGNCLFWLLPVLKQGR